MFTGLVEGVGRVLSAQRGNEELRLMIELPPVFAEQEGSGWEIGDSVAIDGCCLTVVERDAAPLRATFEAGAETLAKTTLGDLTPLSRVNLERALPAAGRFGGHIVQGHIEGVATLTALHDHGRWTDITFTLPEPLAALSVPKGSIAVAGVSLTVVDVGRDRFSVALIPHTLAVTTLGELRPGSRVNIETDLLAKYVHRLLSTGRVIGSP